MTRPLKLYEDYTREEAHDIFSPFTPFRISTGTWGLQGIVKIPNRESDYVFFVTYGRSQAGHDFDESITENGVLTWQSQPQQDFGNSTIINLINHNHLVSNIYLFLRTDRNRQFTFMGKLAYLNHDLNRIKPVYFKWQILDWELPAEKAMEMGLNLIPMPQVMETTTASGMIETAPPGPTSNQNQPTQRNFRARQIDFAENDNRNRQIGKAGELLVVELEKSFLRENGRPDLAEMIIHTSEVEGDGAGYDIQSFTISGEVKYIEVKTTSGGEGTPFIVTLNEVAFSKINEDKYYLYRVYEFNLTLNQGKYFVVRGNIEEQFKLKATQYQAKR